MVLYHPPLANGIICNGSGGKDPAAELSERDNLADETRHRRPSHRHLHHRGVGVKGFYDNVVDEDDQRDYKVDTRRE